MLALECSVPQQANMHDLSESSCPHSGPGAPASLATPLSSPVACQDGIEAVDLTHDHKPDLPEELRRIEDADGRVLQVTSGRGAPGPFRIFLQTGWVPGLSTSRAFGDAIARRVGVISKVSEARRSCCRAPITLPALRAQRDMPRCGPGRPTSVPPRAPVPAARRARG